MSDHPTIPESARANVTLRQLRGFVALAKAGSFTVAGRQLHLTQSALSALLRDLEAQVGARLFDRTTRSMDITAVGRDFLPVAERVLADLDTGLATVRDMNLRRKGSVTVAVTPMLATSFMPSLCAEMRKQFPGVRVVIRDRLAIDNIQSLRSGEADLAIGNFGLVDHDVSLTLVEGSRVGVVMHAQHALAQTAHVEWTQLAQEALILLSRESAFRQFVLQSLMNAGMTCTPEYEVAYMGTALGLAQAGLGLAICPSHVAQTLDPQWLTFRPLVNPVLHDGVYIATLKGRTLSAAAQACLDVALAGRPWPALGALQGEPPGPGGGPDAPHQP